MDLWAYERELTQDGWNVVCGVDEAGRGPLAGPVYAGAVILPPGLLIPGLDDSKKLTPQKRETLFGEIDGKAAAWAVASASVEEIDKLNIQNATYLAMNRAISALAIAPELALIDGNRAEGITWPHMCVVGGDGKSASIAAASIMAKVLRDRYMTELAAAYPQYRFDKHKGYGTKLHYDMIRQYGPSKVHRKKFLEKMH